MSVESRTTILGIDPGTRHLGFGWLVVNGDEVRECRAGALDAVEGDLPLRLADLCKRLAEIVRDVRPDIMVVERVFLGKNPESAFRLGHARGVVLSLAGAAQVPVSEVATRSAKKSVTGSGAATKEDVAQVLRHLLPLPKALSLDASDALALAYHYWRNEHIVRLRMRRHADLGGIG